MNQIPFVNPVFKKAVADIEALGLNVLVGTVANSRPFAVIGGWFNSRWWLYPLENGRIIASSLSLFQPILASSRYIKAATELLSLQQSH